MQDNDLDIFDFRRIFMGDVAPEFLIETVIRIVFIYILLVVSLRMMGKRMSSTLNRNEMAAMVSMAAAIGVPMQVPDRGLLPAVIIAIIVIGTQRGLAFLMLKKSKFETITQGNISTIVHDGYLNLKEMESTGFSKELIYSQLRNEGISNLGTVQRLYLESNGGFSLVKKDKPSPGLSTIPFWDKEFNDLQEKDDNVMACINCGKLFEKQPIDHDTECNHCGSKKKTSATYASEE